MATTDEYSFMSSSTPQSVDSSPYSEKNFNNINDINSGVYSNNSGLTLVQFDCASIYNSATYTDLNDAFLTIPLVMEAVYVVNGSTSLNGSTPPVASHGLLALKNGFINLVHQVEISSGGQVIQNMQPFTNVLKNVKFMSNMSATDLKQLSSSYGFASELDGTGSQKWFTRPFLPGDATGTVLNGGVFPGTGLTNNQAYLNVTDAFVAGSAGPSSYTSDSQTVAGLQNAYTVNPALQKRINRITASASNQVSSVAINANKSYIGGSNIYGDNQAVANAQPVIMSRAELSQEFRSYHEKVGNKMVWYDMAVIPLRWLCDSMRAIGLTKKFDAQIRLYLNTGSLVTPISFVSEAGALLATGFPQYGTAVQSTFSNTCPYTVNTLPFAQTATAISDGFVGTATTGFLVSGLFVAKSPTTSISVGTGPAPIDLGGIINPMQSCRLYYSQIKLEPSRALAYEQENRAKECVYEDFIFNQYSAIPVQGTFSQLIQSGIRNPLALCVIPLISSSCPTTVNGATQIGFNQYGNPYDTCPSTFAPISLTNFQVAIGGSNVFKSGSLFYSFENFLEQFVLADNVVAGMGAANVGVIDQKFWEASRVYWADLSRSTDADKASMRNLVLSFKNNSLVPIDLLVFTVYSSHISVDVANGRVALL